MSYNNNSNKHIDRQQQGSVENSEDYKNLLLFKKEKLQIGEAVLRKITELKIPPERITEVIQASQKQKIRTTQEGWIIKALLENWDVNPEKTKQKQREKIRKKKQETLQKAKLQEKAQLQKKRQENEITKTWVNHYLQHKNLFDSIFLSEKRNLANLPEKMQKTIAHHTALGKLRACLVPIFYLREIRLI